MVEGEGKPITDIEAEVEGVSCESPNRTYRRRFVYVSMLFAWATALFLSKYGAGDIAKTVADSMNTYVIIMGPAYLLGHTVDRSEMLTRMGESFNKKE